MTKKAPSPCRRCKRATSNRNGYCDDHQELAVGWTQRRSSWSGKGSTREWRKKRDSILLRDGYLCQICLPKGLYSEAQIVDHIVPKAEGGTDDDDNLQAICRDCDKVKTATESARGRRRRARGGGESSQPQPGHRRPNLAFASANFLGGGIKAAGGFAHA